MNKPRNYVAIALMRRGGKTKQHKKTTKQLRGKWKRSQEPFTTILSVVV